jgi:hypothetical protein
VQIISNDKILLINQQKLTFKNPGTEGICGSIELIYPEEQNKQDDEKMTATNMTQTEDSIQSQTLLTTATSSQLIDISQTVDAVRRLGNFDQLINNGSFNNSMILLNDPRNNLPENVPTLIFTNDDSTAKFPVRALNLDKNCQVGRAVGKNSSNEYNMYFDTEHMFQEHACICYNYSNNEVKKVESSFFYTC